jgi:hypothetical protein
MARRGYPPEFRRCVVELVEGGRKVVEVAADLGISEQTIYTWRQQARIDVTNIDEPDGNVHAGTKYLAFLRDRYFGDPDILEWDRRALAWAAYNAGAVRRQYPSLRRRLPAVLDRRLPPPRGGA